MQKPIIDCVQMTLLVSGGEGYHSNMHVWTQNMENPSVMAQ
jgi:hypothetical protein